jgi:phage baseplate assembly protein W
MDEETVASLYDTIILAIQKWEPRVSLDYAKSNITPDYDKHVYYVELTFTVRGLTDNNFYTYAGTLFQGNR